MHIRNHIILGIFAVAVMDRVGKELTFANLMVMLISAILIDIDHIITFLLGRKSSNLSLTWSSFMQDQQHHFNTKKQRFYLFHKVEFIFLLFLMSFFSHIFLFIFLGAALHLMLDIAVYYHYHKSVDKLGSFFYYHDVKCRLKRVPAY